MQGPWEKYAGAMGGDPVIAPPDPYKQSGEVRANQDQQLQDEAARIAREKARREALEWSATHNPDGSPKAKAAGASDPKSQAKLANLEALTKQINRVQQLYNETLKDNTIPVLGSVAEYLPSQENARFDSAAAGMAEQGLAAFRVPGVGAQSDTELKQFVEANKPSTWSMDSSNEERLRQLRNRVDETRKAMGLPPAQWDGVEEEGLSGNVTYEGPNPANNAKPPADIAAIMAKYGG